MKCYQLQLYTACEWIILRKEDDLTLLIENAHIMQEMKLWVNHQARIIDTHEGEVVWEHVPEQLARIPHRDFDIIDIQQDEAAPSGLSGHHFEEGRS